MTALSVAGHQRLATAAIIGGAMLWIISGDWLPAAAVGVLWVIWRVLPDESGPPILAVAMSYQWVQVTVGMIYAVVTGRTLLPMQQIDYHPIVIISLCGLLAITTGLWVGRALVGQDTGRSDANPNLAFTWGMLLGSYLLTTGVEGLARGFAFANPSLTQPILALTTIRLIVLYVLFRRLTHPEFQWGKLIALVLWELVLNSTGYFANFREPLILAMIAIAEVFDWDNPRHLITVGALAVGLAFASLVWLSIRADFREEINARESFSRSDRLSAIATLVSDWWRGDEFKSRDDQIDFLVERVWAVYYPALALQRVPRTLPHTNGELLRAAVLHTLQPRIFFPEKPELPSDSELVRRYSGVYVAGREQNTSIAFGYVAESYVDFGTPILLVPMVLFGIAIGAIYGGFQRTLRFAEFRIPTIVVVFWLSLYLYERSWANMMGYSLTLFVYVGLVALLLDRIILIRFEAPSIPEIADTLA